MAVEPILPPQSVDSGEQLTRISPPIEIRPWYDRPSAMLAVLAIPLLIQITPWWQPTEDATGYLSLARAIAHGGPLCMLGSSALRYAIGYPLLISPTFWTSELPLLQIFVMNFLFAMLTAYGIFVWARRYVGNSAFFVSGLTVWNASYLDLYRQPLSETAFLAALIWAALACRRLLDARNVRQIIVMTVVSSALVIAVSTIRQVGIFLAAGYGIAVLVRACRRECSWSRAIMTTLAVGLPASLVLVGLLCLYRSLAEGNAETRTYVDFIVDPENSFRDQIIESVRLRTAEIGRQLVPLFFKAYARRGEWLNPNTLLYLAISVAIVRGWWLLVRTDFDVLILTAPFYLAVYLVWPFDQGTRFMAPMLPILWMCVWRLLANRMLLPNHFLAPLLIAHLAQSLVYWSVYLIAAQKCHVALKSLQELVPALHNRQSIVCCVGVTKHTQMFANLLLDRSVPAAKMGETLSPAANFAITDRIGAEIPGFVLERRAGTISLYAKQE